MKKVLSLALGCGLLLFNSCTSDDLEVPTTYSFERDGLSTISFTGQTDRIRMATELTDALGNFDEGSIQSDLTRLQDMFNNPEGADPFGDTALNSSTKSVSGKVAASQDYFASNTVEQAIYRQVLNDAIIESSAVVYPARNTAASAGVPGQINDSGTARYINAKGIEPDQIVEKSLIGALMADQMLNNYLSTSVLDQGSNRADNDAGVLVDGKPYTNMEHKWDEAFGYLFGNASTPSDPVAEIGTSDLFLNKYLGRVEGDSDFAGITQDIFDALIKGRAAIVAGDYEERDLQASLIRDAVSDVIGIRAVYYLAAAQREIEADNRLAAFHDLSEGIGFINSLRFTRNTTTDEPYFTTAEIQDINDRLYGADDGLWSVDTATLETLAEEIAARFDWTVAQAATIN
jgi:hypothetical protein